MMKEASMGLYQRLKKARDGEHTPKHSFYTRFETLKLIARKPYNDWEVADIEDVLMSAVSRPDVCLAEVQFPGKGTEKAEIHNRYLLSELERRHGFKARMNFLARTNCLEVSVFTEFDDTYVSPN